MLSTFVPSLAFTSFACSPIGSLVSSFSICCSPNNVKVSLSVTPSLARTVSVSEAISHLFRKRTKLASACKSLMSNINNASTSVQSPYSIDRTMIEPCNLTKRYWNYHVVKYCTPILTSSIHDLYPVNKHGTDDHVQ